MSDFKSPSIDQRAPDEQQVPIDPNAQPITTEQKLDLPDDMLAMHGVSRELASARKKLSRAEQSLEFHSNYVPTHPGEAPHPEAGGMDHADYRVALMEYNNSDQESDQAISWAESDIRKTEDEMYDLFEDREDIMSGDEDKIAYLAEKARKILETELKKEKSKKAQDEHWELYKKGAEIEGAATLYAELSALADIDKADFKKGEQPNGWQFISRGTDGIGDTDGRYFVRNYKQGPLGVYTEMIEISRKHNETGERSVSYTVIPKDSEVTNSKVGLTTVDDAEHFYFSIKDDGVVGSQIHNRGLVTRGPNSSGSGGDEFGNTYHTGSTFHVNTNRMDKAHQGASPDAQIDAADIAKIAAAVKGIQQTVES